TKRLGHACARAALANGPSASAAPADTAIKRRRVTMALSARFDDERLRAYWLRPAATSAQARGDRRGGPRGRPLFFTACGRPQEAPLRSADFQTSFVRAIASGHERLHRPSDPALASADAGANLRPVSARGRGVRACAASWRAGSRARGRAPASVGLPAIPDRGSISAAARRRECRPGAAARADHRAGPVSLVAQPDVPRASDLPRRPRVDVLVVVRADRAGRPRHLVPTPRAA